MSYTTPRTWVTGELVTAALLNEQIRDNTNAEFPIGVTTWTGYVPTLTQSGAVTNTTTYAKYMKVGRTVWVNILLDITGSGTASNVVLVGLPFTSTQAGAMAIGSGYIFDTSAATTYSGIAQAITTTTVRIFPGGSGTNPLGLGTFTAALAAGDQVSMTLQFEATT